MRLFKAIQHSKGSKAHVDINTLENYQFTTAVHASAVDVQILRRQYPTRIMALYQRKPHCLEDGGSADRDFGEAYSDLSDDECAAALYVVWDVQNRKILPTVRVGKEFECYTLNKLNPSLAFTVNMLLVNRTPKNTPALAMLGPIEYCKRDELVSMKVIKIIQ
jgi:hypothetical protein